MLFSSSDSLGRRRTSTFVDPLTSTVAIIVKPANQPEHIPTKGLADSGSVCLGGGILSMKVNVYIQDRVLKLSFPWETL